MKRIEVVEAAVTILGLLLMVAALAAFDLRVGLFAGGLFLTASVIDIPRRRA